MSATKVSFSRALQSDSSISTLPRIGPNKPGITVDRARLTPTSKLLTKNQLRAFYEAFLLFDHKRNGRISCEEFLETLRRVGVTVNEKVVYDLIVSQDDNGNGELDFEEYVNFMTNEDIFIGLIGAGAGNQANGNLHAPVKPLAKDVLLYEVMTEFIRKSCLHDTQRKEIVGYYTRKLKKVATKQQLMTAAHVVHHYADGARSLGLTEKEIFLQIEQIKLLTQNEGDEKKKNSPYANPMQLILTPTSTHKNNRNLKKVPGWNPPAALTYGVKLPSITIQETKTFENVREIRKKVQTVKEDYYWDLSKAQNKNFNELWKILHVPNIHNHRLKSMLEGVYSTYTASRLTETIPK